MDSWVFAEKTHSCGSPVTMSAADLLRGTGTYASGDSKIIYDGVNELIGLS